MKKQARCVFFRRDGDARLAASAAVNADAINDSKDPHGFENQRRSGSSSPRTLADMAPEEKRALERLYGAKICGTVDRRRKV